MHTFNDPPIGNEINLTMGNPEYAFGIIGLGPTGLMAAIMLGEKVAQENPNLKIIAFEKRNHPIRQQGVYLNKAKRFILDLANRSPQDEALMKKIQETRRGELNLKDLETFLRKRLPSNVEIVYLEDEQTLDIVPTQDKHLIRVESLSKTETSSSEARDYYCHHILGADGIAQYSTSKIEKNFHKEIINLTDDDISYHASVQLKVDIDHAQSTQIIQPKTTHKALDSMVLNRSGASSKNKQKYSVTLEIRKELFSMSNPDRDEILLDMAKNAVVHKHPDISKNSLIFHHSQKWLKKNKLRISCFTTQKRYCLSRAIPLDENLYPGFYLPLGLTRKTVDYKNGEGIGFGYEDAKTAADCFDLNPLSFDSERYITQLDRLDETYLSPKMKEEIIILSFERRLGSLSKEQQLDHWIDSGAIKIENNELTINPNEEIQLLFDESHLQVLRSIFDNHSIKSVRISDCLGREPYRFVSQVIEVAANKDIEALNFTPKQYDSPKNIIVLKKYAHCFKQIEITCAHNTEKNWLNFFDEVIDEENNRLIMFNIKKRDSSTKIENFSLEMKFELTHFLKLIANTENLSEDLEKLVQMKDVKTHEQLLEARDKLLEEIRINPFEMYEKLLSIKEKLAIDSPLMPTLSCMVTQLLRRENKIADEATGQYSKHIEPGHASLNPATKTLTLNISEKFQAKNEEQVLGLLKLAKENDCSTLVITLPSNPNPSFMDAPLFIMQQLDTEYGKGINNLIIMPREAQAQNARLSYYFIEAAMSFKDAFLRHGKYVKIFQIACRSGGEKYAFFQDLPEKFKQKNGRDVELVIHDPYKSITIKQSTSVQPENAVTQQMHLEPFMPLGEEITEQRFYGTFFNNQRDVVEPAKSASLSKSPPNNVVFTDNDVTELMHYYKHAT